MKENILGGRAEKLIFWLLFLINWELRELDFPGSSRRTVADLGLIFTSDEVVFLVDSCYSKVFERENPIICLSNSSRLTNIYVLRLCSLF